MTGAGARAIAPAFASSLYSASLSKHLASGNFVFYVLIGISLIGILVATRLQELDYVDK